MNKEIEQSTEQRLGNPYPEKKVEKSKVKKAKTKKTEE